MRKLLTLALAAACVLAGLWVTPAATAGAPVVQVYFLQGEQLVAVDRPGSTIREAVTALIDGPTAEEAERNVRSYVPSETVLRDVSFANGVARVDLGEAFGAGRDAGELSSRLAQLVYTVTSVPGVKRVRVLLKGGTPLGLFPGVDLTKPVRATDVERPVVPPPESPDDETLPPPGPDTLELQQRLPSSAFSRRAASTGSRASRRASRSWPSRSGPGSTATESRGRPRSPPSMRPSARRREPRAAPAHRGAARPPARAPRRERARAADGHRLDGRAGHRDASGQLLDLPQGGAVLSSRSRSGCRGRATSSAGSPSTSTRTSRRTRPRTAACACPATTPSSSTPSRRSGLPYASSQRRDRPERRCPPHGPGCPRSRRLRLVRRERRAGPAAQRHGRAAGTRAGRAAGLHRGRERAAGANRASRASRPKSPPPAQTGEEEQPAGPETGEEERTGALVVGLNLPSPGFQVGAVRGEEVVFAKGFEIDLARALARELGFEHVRFVHVERFGRLFSPGDKQWDIALAQATITDERAANVDFSVPYLEADQGSSCARAC